MSKEHLNYLRRKTADEAELWAADRIDELVAERDELKADAMRLNWIDKVLFQHQWNGVVGAGAKTYWRIAGDYRQTAAKMEGETFREAIDAAIGETFREAIDAAIAKREKHNEHNL